MKTQRAPVSFFAAAATLLLAIMLYDIMGATIKHLSQRYSAEQLSLLRNLFGLLPTTLILLWSRRWIEAGRPIVLRQWKLALFRGCLGVTAQVCFFIALSHLEFATATTILFAGPLFVTALSMPVLGHRVGLWRWMAVTAGFIGVVLVMRPNADSFSWYAVLPLCAAFGFACITVTAQRFDKTVPTALINLYQNVTALIGTIALVSFTGGFVPIASSLDWLWIVGMGAAGGIAIFCLISAYRLADPSSLSPLEYLGIPFSFFLGWVFFAEAPFERLIPGVFLIVGGGLFIVWREHSLKRRGAAG